MQRVDERRFVDGLTVGRAARVTVQTSFPRPGPLCEPLDGLKPADILARLCGTGRIAVTGHSSGVLHERIGPVDRLCRSGRTARIGGLCHEATVDLDALAGVVLDGAPGLSGKAGPRLHFLDMAGAPVFSVSALGAAERFEKYLTRAGYKAKRFGRKGQALACASCHCMPLDDPARWPFCKLCATPRDVAVVLDRVGLRQVWRGRIDSFCVASGELSVLAEDFRLSIPTGTIARWESGRHRVQAICKAGRPIGLTLVSPALV